MPQQAIPYMQFRGGSSKGVYFLASDLPADPGLRDQYLLEIVGRDARQIDGLGGAQALTSKVAIIAPSSHPEADIDYLFVQVVVGENCVDTTPNCGNILAGVGPFAIESGLITPKGSETSVVVRMLNSDKLCELQLQTPNGEMNYVGDARIDGVPGSSAPIICNYRDIAGSACGSLLPTGNLIDVIDGIEVSCIDNGMPVVVLRAEDMGIRGDEPPAELNANVELKAALQSIRLQLGPKMNLGDVDGAAVPKMCIVSAAKHGGLIHTRTFIPYQCHEAIGVLGAVSVATACILPGSVTYELARQAYSEKLDGELLRLSVEHPSGEFSVSLQVDRSKAFPEVTKAGVLRTARLLSRGEAFICEASKLHE